MGRQSLRCYNNVIARTSAGSVHMIAREHESMTANWEIAMAVTSGEVSYVDPCRYVKEIRV